jgi:glutamyl-Q tRNA(Asp) synthetase
MIVTRFAPSPNGPLHLGHAFSAIAAHDLALGTIGRDDPLAAAAKGRFLLRIEDIDTVRSRAELAEDFREDLAWLGLSFDQVPAQSKRLRSYALAAKRLFDMGLLYPCNCTRAAIKSEASKIGPEGPIYPGTCRPKNSAVPFPSDNLMSGDYAWRLDTKRAMAVSGKLVWHDQLAGAQIAQSALLGDPVLLRKSEPASYHLAVVVDDAADGVTLVTRGKDLFHATHVHRLLQSLLGLPVPRWHHHPLLLDQTGRKLAKRRGSQGLSDMRREDPASGKLLAEQLRLRRLPLGISLSDP